MKLLLSKHSKNKLLCFLKTKHNCSTLKDLSNTLNIPKKTLEGWFYLEERYISKSFVEKYALKNLEIIYEREDNWGQIKGGKKSYNLAINKEGLNEIKRRQSLGGKNAAKTKLILEKQKFNVDIKDPMFLEFYGALMGDGWINHLGSKNKWLIGICGNLSLDKIYIIYLKNSINILFDRKGYIKRNPKGNTIEFLFKHKVLVEFMKNKLRFPLGKKKNLKIHRKIYNLEFDKLKHVIRGIFDTDGSFYLSKNRSGSLSPNISIYMNSPTLISQISRILINKGFKVSNSNNGKMIKLRGKKQLNKWMREIGYSNPKHLNKINKFMAP